MKIIHVSDVHFVPPGQRLLGFDPEARLREVVASVNLDHPDADLCVISGDLTDRGDVESYAFLRDALHNLTVPCRLMLGNHDRRAAFAKVFPEHIHSADGFVQTYHRGDEADLLLLDTLDEADPASGLLCEARLGWTGRALEAARERPVVVFAHHPPFRIGMPWFDGMLLRNGCDLMTLLAQHSQVAHLAFGHVHLDMSGIYRGLSFSATRGTAHKIAFSQTREEAVYVDAGPSYDILLATADGVVVHHQAQRDLNTAIARELATPDGAGSFELFDQPRPWRQLDDVA
jgi:3',5'-cyclic-AMP phosphodiesterase